MNGKGCLRTPRSVSARSPEHQEFGLGEQHLSWIQYSTIFGGRGRHMKQNRRLLALLRFLFLGK